MSPHLFGTSQKGRSSRSSTSREVRGPSASTSIDPNGPLDEPGVMEAPLGIGISRLPRRPLKGHCWANEGTCGTSRPVRRARHWWVDVGTSRLFQCPTRGLGGAP